MHENRTCDVNPIFIEQFIDNQLSYEESAEISAHLKTCDICKKHYNGIMDIREALRSIQKSETLTAIEHHGFEKLIDETNPPATLLNLLEAAKEFLGSHGFFSAAVSTALTVMVFFFAIKISDIDRENNKLISDIINIHQQETLPNEFTEKDNVETVVTQNLKINTPQLRRLLTRTSKIRGRFDQLASIPIASIKIEDIDGKGTLLLSKNNTELNKLIDQADCIEEVNCKARKQRVNGRDMLMWKNGDNNYIFVTDSNRMRSNMVRLISAE